MESKLVTFKNYESMVDAMFELDLLKKNKVECVMNNEESVGLLPMFGEINEGIRILVLESDLEKSHKIIDKYHSDTA